MVAKRKRAVVRAYREAKKRKCSHDDSMVTDFTWDAPLNTESASIKMPMEVDSRQMHHAAPNVPIINSISQAVRLLAQAVPNRSCAQMWKKMLSLPDVACLVIVQANSYLIINGSGVAVPNQPPRAP